MIRVDVLISIIETGASPLNPLKVRDQPGLYYSSSGKNPWMLPKVKLAVDDNDVSLDVFIDKNLVGTIIIKVSRLVLQCDKYIHNSLTGGAR